MSQPRSPPDPPVSELSTPNKYQREYSADRYHTLLAAVQHKYRIDDNPSGPGGLHKVSFGAYTDRSLESTEAAVDPRDKQPAYIEHLHKILRNNIRALDGGILYIIKEPQIWPLIEYFHSHAKTSGRDDWDSMFETLRTTPRQDIVLCVFVNSPSGCQWEDCPYLHPTSPEMASQAGSLIQSRRLYLKNPTKRNRYTYVRNVCNVTGDRPMDDAVMDEAEKLTAICDNGLCAKTAKADGSNLLVCGGCGWARYCSVVCQKLCRKRHKMVCIDHHILSMEDDLWTVDGDLKGQPTFKSELAQGRFGTTV